METTISNHLEDVTLPDPPINWIINKFTFECGFCGWEFDKDEEAAGFEHHPCPNDDHCPSWFEERGLVEPDCPFITALERDELGRRYQLLKDGPHFRSIVDTYEAFVYESHAYPTAAEVINNKAALLRLLKRFRMATPEYGYFKAPKETPDTAPVHTCEECEEVWTADSLIADEDCPTCRKRAWKITPEEQENQNAINLIFNRLMEKTDTVANNPLVLLQNPEFSIYLIPTPQEAETSNFVPEGAVEYQVSDGLPGQRSHSNDFDNLADAVAFYNLLVTRKGDWKTAWKKSK